MAEESRLVASNPATGDGGGAGSLGKSLGEPQVVVDLSDLSPYRASYAGRGVRRPPLCLSPIHGARLSGLRDDPGDQPALAGTSHPSRSTSSLCPGRLRISRHPGEFSFHSRGAKGESSTVD